MAESQNPQGALLCTVRDGMAFTGNINQEDAVEWDWDRVPVALGMQTAKDHLLLRRGRCEFEKEFSVAQVSFSQFHYRGLGSDKETGKHTMESTALLLMIALMPCRKSVRNNCKVAALETLKAFLELCMGKTTHTCACSALGDDYQFHAAELKFVNGVSDELGALLVYHAESKDTWERLGKLGWCGHRVTSSLTHTSIFDAMLFLVFAKTRQANLGVWKAVGQYIWPRLIWLIGNALDQYAEKLAEKPARPVPLLKIKSWKQQKNSNNQ